MKTVIAHLLKGVLPGLLLLSLPLTTIAQPLLPGEVRGAQHRRRKRLPTLWCPPRCRRRW